jgi:hypothetical protein
LAVFGREYVIKLIKAVRVKCSHETLTKTSQKKKLTFLNALEDPARRTVYGERWMGEQGVIYARFGAKFHAERVERVDSYRGATPPFGCARQHPRYGERLG